MRTSVGLAGVGIVDVAAAVKTNVIGWHVVRAEFVRSFIAAGVRFPKIEVVGVFKCKKKGVTLSASVGANLGVIGSVRHVGGEGCGESSRAF